MDRPIRIEFAGALHRITARGDRRQAIRADDLDRRAFLEVVADTNWSYHTNCLMSSYCHVVHVVVETPDTHRSKGMREFDGVYPQDSNPRFALGDA